MATKTMAQKWEAVKNEIQTKLKKAVDKSSFEEVRQESGIHRETLVRVHSGLNTTMTKYRIVAQFLNPKLATRVGNLENQMAKLIQKRLKKSLMSTVERETKVSRQTLRRLSEGISVKVSTFEKMVKHFS